VPSQHFEDVLGNARSRHALQDDNQLSPDAPPELVQKYVAIVRKHAGTDFPHDPDAQLWGAIAAVFRSWNSPRAVSYREMYHYPDHWGTAVNVQAMVFGNMGDDCATGVAFTRDPSTGEPGFTGEYLVNAQGEDVVAGIRTPLPVNNSPESLEARMPAQYKELVDLAGKLERHFGDVQDVEFTIEKGRLWMLQ